MTDPNPSSLLEQVLRLNARFPATESEKFDVTTTAERLLASYRKESSPTHELSYAVIRLLRHLRRYPEGLALMQERRPVLKKQAREVDFYEIELHFLGGRRQEGEALLDAFLSHGYTLRPSWERAIAKIRHLNDTNGVWDELAALERRIATLEGPIQPDADLPLLQRVLRHPNEALELLVFVQDRMAALDRLEEGEATADLSRFDKYHSGRLIFTCGFSWSGSGAVTGFLGQHRSVSQPFGMSELDYLQGRAGRRGIFALLKPGAVSFQQMKQLLATFFIESIVCPGTLKPFSVLLQCMRGVTGCILSLGELVDDFNAAMLATDARTDPLLRRVVLARFLQRLLSIKGGSNILLNNVFMAARIELAGDMENAVFLAVERDARDQYVARRTESRIAAGRDVREFGAMLAGARSQFGRICSGIDPDMLAQRVLTVRFESFVSLPAERQRVLDWLGLDPAGIVIDTESFDPSVSMRNVGIHEGALGSEERAYLEQEVGIHLYSPPQ